MIDDICVKAEKLLKINIEEECYSNSKKLRLPVATSLREDQRLHSIHHVYEVKSYPLRHVRRHASGPFALQSPKFNRTISIIGSQSQLANRLESNILQKRRLPKPFNMEGNLENRSVKIPTYENLLDYAREARRNILCLPNFSGLTESELSLATKYIETKLPEQIEAGRFYLRKADTNLPCDIEYDPASKLLFIHLDEEIGRGGLKIVYKSILYDRKNPQMIATAISKESKELLSEIKVLEQLKGLGGIVELVAATTIDDGAGQTKSCHIMTPLYSYGSLKTLMEHERSLHLYDKVSMAVDFFLGLTSAHNAQLAHGDIHNGNVLVNYEPNSSKSSPYQLVLMDFGTSREINTTNKEHLETKDLYAAGCMLFELFHNLHRQPHWNNLNNFANIFKETRVITPENANNLLLGEIKDATDRMRALEKKKDQVQLSSSEAFEYVILQMMHPKLTGNKSAADYLRDIKIIFEDMQTQEADRKSNRSP